MQKTILIFDFLSHPNMHLPFNEGYIKSMRTAFPDDEIIFAATAEHVTNIQAYIEPKYNIILENINNFDQLLGDKSYHNPFYGLPAAKKCWKALQKLTNNRQIRHVCLLGANGALIHSFSKRWKDNQSSSIHYIQHNQLSTSMKWRSKNPIYKYFDYLSVVSRGLPKNQKLVLLELGLDNEIIKLAPKIESSLVTIEHPVQEREWLPIKELEDNKPINIGFVGNCGVGKGFDRFLRLAKKFAGDKYQFYAIGKNNTKLENGLTLDCLKVKPSNGHLPRDQFVKLLSEIDIVCLPLPKTISYVSSGSIIDAFAASKPLIISTNQSVRAIQEKYGEYGIVYSTDNELNNLLNNLTHEQLKQLFVNWHTNIQKIKENRSEQGVATQLRANIE
ncbi:MAG: hypothetical protein ACJAXJ_000031 [Colwellia sp.]|jgi:hypothetical protein